MIVEVIIFLVVVRVAYSIYLWVFKPRPPVTNQEIEKWFDEFWRMIVGGLLAYVVLVVAAFLF